LGLKRGVKIEKKEKTVVLSLEKTTKEAKSLWGTYWALITNMVKGVTEGYEKKLELNGTGYKVSVSGKKLLLELGYSHPITIEAPEGISFMVEKNVITVLGIDKQVVGEIAAQIRSKRKVEPYKGKGLRYIDEFVRRKSGKKAAGEGAK
jgi:large subunit ribosomal protein L6